MGIYYKNELKKQSFLQKLFGKFPKENYIIELQNFLSENEENILAINLQDIENIKTKYKVNAKAVKYELEYLLNKYIDYCLLDKKLSDTEKEELVFLCRILGLDENFLETRIREEGEKIYRNKVQFVISDDELTDSEKAELDTIKNNFNLSEETSNDIYKTEAQKKIQDYVNEIVRNRRISPEEERKLNEMISGLKIKVSFTDNGIQLFRKYWDIENAPLESLDSPIVLQKNENLFYFDNIEWYEERTRTTHVSYAGLTQNIRIMKGMKLKFGDIAPTRYTEEYMKLIDSGKVYFTNKRIIFTGMHGNKILPLSKILYITPFADGIEIGKDTAKKPFFKTNNSELMGIYLTRLLKEC